MRSRGCRPWRRRCSNRSRATTGWLWSRAMGAADDNPGGNGERFALIKVRDGAVLADGDELFTNREAAIDAFASGAGGGLEAIRHARPDIRRRGRRGY